MFIPNTELDTKRRKYIEEYDIVFSRIQQSVKGSIEHLELIKIEKKLERRTYKFIDSNKGYFELKRRYLMRDSNIARAQFLPLETEEKKIFGKEYEPRNPCKPLKNFAHSRD